MGTRAVIGTAHDGGFSARYTHWDGYPDGIGPTLLRCHAELGSWEQVRDWAVKPGQTGYWSSFAAPSEVAEQEAKPEKITCTLCGGTGVRSDGRFQERGPNCNGCSDTGQMINSDRRSTWVPTAEDTLVEAGDDVGAEWAYLLDERGVTVLAFLRGDGEKAIGMFGSIGDGHWASAGTVTWDATDVDWERLACGQRYQRCVHYAWAHFPDAKDTEYGTAEWLEMHPDLLPSAPEQGPA